MMSSTLGAPLGGKTRGGHQGVESLAVSLITPQNGGAGAGSCFPSTVVVASAEPRVPVTRWAATGATVSVAANRNATALPTKGNSLNPDRMLRTPFADTKEARNVSGKRKDSKAKTVEDRPLDRGRPLAKLLSDHLIISSLLKSHVAFHRERPALVMYRFGAALFYANANRFAEEV